jgi:dolichol-phosphate mannosyltransferase
LTDFGEVLKRRASPIAARDAFSGHALRPNHATFPLCRPAGADAIFPVIPAALLPTAATTRALVVVPTYNEAASLPLVLDAVLGAAGGVDVLVVDDNSPDGTAEVARAHREFGRRVFLRSRPAKLGLGSAYKAGFAWAVEQGYDVALEMDADLSHDPADVSRLLAALDAGADMAIGSRYLRGVSVVHWPLARLALSMAAGVYARWVAGVRLTDPTSGFKAIRRRVLESLDWEKITADGYGFQIALHFFAQRAGFRLAEVPIVFTERREGQSKLSRGIALEAAWLVIKLGATRFRDGVTGGPGRRRT